MHTATQLDSSMFAIEIDGRRATRDELLPGWDLTDRVGVICTEPLGAVGASLLLQLAITAFFDARPERRSGRAQYPEIYLFHVGERYGDHSYFDFWPERKEVTVDRDARAILSVINARGVTRLVVVDGDPTPTEHRDAEFEPALDRIRAAFAYHPSGRVPDADVAITGLDPHTEVNAEMTLDPERALATPVDLPDSVARSAERTIWLERFGERVSETTPTARERAAARREAIRENGCASESYRRIPVAQALNMLTGPARGATREPELAVTGEAG